MTDTRPARMVDPDLVPLLEGFPAIDLGPDTLDGFRTALHEMAVLPDPAGHPGTTIEEAHIPGPDGPSALRCLVLRPNGGPPRSALLHIHGGGFVMGSPEMDVARNLALVEALGCVVVSVDYRLAPEHPYPAAREDCHAAAIWLVEQAQAWGFDPAKTGLIGESAGGGLAAQVAVAARDRMTASFACQALIEPMLGPPGSESPATQTDGGIGQHVWTRTSNGYAWDALLGGRNLPDLHGDLTRLPPTFVAAAELDLFVHDCLGFASRLIAAGNSVEAHCYPGAFHGFERMDQAAVSRRFTADLLAFLGRHLH